MADVANSSPAQRVWPDDRSSRVPNWVYTDPDIFRRELDRIFAASDWLYVCLESEIPNPGDFKRSQLGNRDVIAVRGTDGAINVLVNRCAHRSMQVCTAGRGAVKEFVCPYHQWTYDLAGNLLGVPFRRGYRGQGGMPADFRPEEHGLQRLAVTARHGVVFASFGAPNEPLETYLGDRMLGWFDRVFDGRELVVLGHMRQRIPANWKLMFENIKDPYHASLLHVFLVTFACSASISSQPSRWTTPAATPCWSAVAVNSRPTTRPRRCAPSSRTSPCATSGCWTRCASSPAMPPWCCRRSGPT
jgi:salicylate 5-hydroxylase large subunit